jgi:hypothetical protein
MATSKSKTSRGHDSSNASSARSHSRASEPPKVGGAAPSRSRAAQTTTDHEEIQEWAEERGAHPACVKGTGRGKGDIGILRLDFPGFSGGESLQQISWEEFFKAFDGNKLAFVYQETTATGERSNFNKIVKRDASDEEEDEEDEDEDEEDEEEEEF